jgi:hypothetical protein
VRRRAAGRRAAPSCHCPKCSERDECRRRSVSHAGTLPSGGRNAAWGQGYWVRGGRGAGRLLGADGCPAALVPPGPAQGT